MRFSKLQGLGNDFVLLDALRAPLPTQERGLIAQSLCDRRRGVGADGLLILESARAADCAMRVYNADGSEAEMCGNGIRCLALYYHRYHSPSTNTIQIETVAGLRTAHLSEETNTEASQVSIDMGAPRWHQGDIPVLSETSDLSALDLPLSVEGNSFQVTCINVGNPHAVLFVDSVDSFPLEQIGPLVEHFSLFPERINLQVAQILSEHAIRLRTWERGAGLTPGCGTGACAAVTAGVLKGLLKRSVLVHLPGGDLQIDWMPDQSIQMTGPAVELFQGEWLL